eukprot:2399067-Amphidinium_carterae.1
MESYGLSATTPARLLCAWNQSRSAAHAIKHKGPYSLNLRASLSLPTSPLQCCQAGSRLPQSELQGLCLGTFSRCAILYIPSVHHLVFFIGSAVTGVIASIALCRSESWLASARSLASLQRHLQFRGSSELRTAA